MSDQAWKRFERKVAEMVSTAWCGHPKALSRMPLQGRMLEQKWGDIIPNSRAAQDGVPMLAQVRALWVAQHFYIDAKHRKSWSLLGLLTAEKHPFWEWFSKVIENCGCKSPLIVLSEGRKVLVAMPVIVIMQLNLHCGKLSPFVEVNTDSRKVIICELDKFLDFVDVDTLDAPKAEPAVATVKESVCPTK